MNRDRLIGVLLAVGFGSTEAPGQSTRPTPTEEQFITIRQVRTQSGDRVLQLRRVDFLEGKMTLLASADSWRTDVFPRCSLLDGRGRPLILRRVQAGEDASSGQLELLAPQSSAPTRVFQEMKVERMLPSARSPDGEKIAFVDAQGRLIVGGELSVTIIPRTWLITGPLSWSPDSRCVAFYYTESREANDFFSQKHGVAAVSHGGEVWEVVDASQALGTPLCVGKHIPIGWNRDGSVLYFTEGRLERNGEGTAGQEPCRSCNAGVYRRGIAGGQAELVAEGEFADIAPDGTYILVCSVVPANQGADWVTRTSKVELATGSVTHLPKGVAYPKISPSGDKAVVVLDTEGMVQCFRTMDWSPDGEPVRVSERGFSVDEWGRDFRWITVEDEEAFRRQFATQPAP